MKNILKFLFLSLLFKISLFASPEGQAALLAHDAYLNPQEFLLKYKSPEYELVSKKADNIKFYIFSKKRELIIVFEGTNNLASIQTDLDLKEVAFLNNKKSRVHNGYFSEAKAAYEKLSPYLNKEKKIIIIGHSLGGAVGHLLAALLYKQAYHVQLYTFGAPPVGNEDFVSMIKDLPHKRYTHVFDLIPLLKKEYISKVKEALTYVNTELVEDESLVSVLDSIDTFSYRYMHQGEHFYIYNLGTLSKEYEQSPWYSQVLMRAELYHSSKNYLEGLQ